MANIAHNSRIYVKSNYLLASLRKKFSTPKEVYVKWNLIKEAFNGSVFIKDTYNIDVIFVTHDIDLPDTNMLYTTIDIGDMLISIYDGYHKYLWLDEFLQKESNEFDKKYPKLEAINNKISRLYGGIIISDVYVANFKSLILNIFGDYSIKWFDLSIDENNLFTTENKTIYADIIIDFNDAIEEQELSYPLRNIFINYEPPILGWGYICINHAGGDCVTDEIKWVHLFGKHF